MPGAPRAIPGRAGWISTCRSTCTAGRTTAAAQEYVNRHYTPKEEDISIAQNFKHGLEFIDENFRSDNWFLQLEEFDPHEPYYVPDRFLSLYEKEYHGPPL